jgi:dTDP-4-amino-4,6-dideoxygalactose transaminase
VKYQNLYKGLNSRLDEIQAAALRVKLARLDSDNQHRREIAGVYLSNITNKKIILPFISQPVVSNMSHVWHVFVIRTPNRDRLQDYLLKNGVQTLIHYPIPLHKQPAYKELGNLHLPLTEMIHNEVLSLPISPIMNIEDARQVCDLLNQYE